MLSKKLSGIFAAVLFVFCTSAFADSPHECTSNPGACGDNPPGNGVGLEKFNDVHVPGTLVLVGLGLAGLIFSRKGK